MQPRTFIVIALSLALGILGLYLSLGEAVFRAETYRVESLGLPLAIFVLLAFLAKWVSPGVRIGLLCRTQGAPVSYRSGLLAYLSAMFVAAFTPNNTGLAPATIAALGRLGVPLGRGLGVAVQALVLDLIFFAWAVPLGLAYLVRSGTIALPEGAGSAAIALSALAITGAVVLIRYPRLVARLLLTAARWRPTRRFASRLRKAARDYYRSARAFKEATVATWIVLNLLTITQWFGSFLLFWALLRLYGAEIGPVMVVAILSSLTLISHFVPTPGAAGFMEAAVGLSLGESPGGGVAAALLIWRLASFYLIFLLGPFAGWLLHLSSMADDREREASTATPVDGKKPRTKSR